MMCSTSCALEYIDIPALRPDEFGGTVGDIDSRTVGIPSAGISYKYYRHEDKTTWVHEGTHSINARIRNMPNIDNGFYLLQGKGITFKNVSFSLRDLAKTIPVSKRGHLYDLYLIKAQQYRNDQPFYCFDELVAYINGCTAGVENNLWGLTKYSLQNAKQMYIYCEYMVKLCERTNYSEQKKLEDFMVFLNNRIKILEKIVADK